MGTIYQSIEILSKEKGIDPQIVIDAVKRSPNSQQLVVLDRQFTFEPLALALPRDDEDFRLLVDQSLSGIYKSKEFYSLYTTWFGVPPLSTLTFFVRTALPD